jgi:hypothetical protein
VLAAQPAGHDHGEAGNDQPREHHGHH